jgi:hypothetical protein
MGVGGSGGGRGGGGSGGGHKTDGEKYKLSPSRKNEILVKVSVNKIENSWKKDSMYLPKDGLGKSEIGGRRKAFSDWKVKHKGEPIEAPSVSINKKNNIVFNDGRSRFAVLRGEGKKTVYVSIEKSDAKKLKKSFS